MDPDQLASEKSADQDLYFFVVEYIGAQHGKGYLIMVQSLKALIVQANSILWDCNVRMEFYLYLHIHSNPSFPTNPCPAQYVGICHLVNKG